MKKAYYRMIPAFFDPKTNEIKGRNWFYSFLIDLNIWFDVNVVKVEEFPILVEEENLDDRSNNEEK